MYFKILKKDIKKKKFITLAVFIFIMLSAFLLASGANMIMNLFQALDTMYDKACIPHFMQYHAGSIDQEMIDQWSTKNGLVEKQQTTKQIHIDGTNIYMNQSKESIGSSNMEMMFVTQNKSIDYLLDLNNDRIILNESEIGIPIYLMQKHDLNIGDIVTIKSKTYTKNYVIKAFVRDALMNPSFVSSKRLVVSDSDFKELEKSFHETEYQIAFLLKDKTLISDFTNDYSVSNLPMKGPTIDYQLIMIANLITDGIIMAVIFIISLLLCLIAVLCLRFTIISTLEEDYREIGVMKAIGFKQSQIKKVYITKYIMVSMVACIIGYIVSLFFNELFLNNILLYVGHAELDVFQSFVPLMITAIVFLVVILFCNFTINRFKRITTIEALRLGNTGETFKSKSFLALYKTKRFNINIVMGIRDVVLKLRIYGLLFFVFLVCMFIIIVPLNIYQTIQSDEFITYMGLGKSDILIDIRQTEDVNKRYSDVLDYIERDRDVEKFSPLITSRFTIITDDGLEDNLLIETGDFTIFPIQYIEGVTPLLENEIALSYLSAKDLGKRVGERLKVIVDSKPTSLLITGIYQDVTDGGKTAKACIRPNYDTVAWYLISLNVDSDVAMKIREYSTRFAPVKVIDMKGYIIETFGNTISQLRLIIIVTGFIALIVAFMITSLFIRMLIVKESLQISIMRNIGFSFKNIRLQYITKGLLVLISGMIGGLIISNTLGDILIGLLLERMGISHINLVVNILQVYVGCPIILVLTVTAAIVISTQSIKKLKNTKH